MKIIIQFLVAFFTILVVINPVLSFKEKNNQKQKQIFRFVEDGLNKFTQKNSLSEKNAPKLIKQGWLRISSVHFVDKQKYPDIPISSAENSPLETQSGTQDASQSQSQLFRRNKRYTERGPIPSPDSFWFRISGTNLYYTSTSSDMVVLGAIAIRNLISTTQTSNQNCFKVENQEKDEWELCAKDLKDRENWFCAIMQAQGLDCGKNSQQKNENIVQQPIIIIPKPSPQCNENWNYGQHGQNWICKCSEGTMQSPINLGIGCAQPLNNTVQEMSFQRVPINNLALYYEDNMMKLKCGLSEEKCLDFSFGKLIDFDYTEYIAKEIRFHTPGDHTINNRRFDMEVQLVFQAISDGDFRKKSIISVLIMSQPGEHNLLLDVLDPMSLPNMAIKKIELRSENYNKKIEDISFEDIFKRDQNDLFYGYFNYFYYQGSLTSPPCDEYVNWFVAEEPMPFSYSGIEMIKGVLDTPSISDINQNSQSVASITNFFYNQNPTGNNRNLQPLLDRQTYYFNALKNGYKVPDLRRSQQLGHYERMQKSMTSYFWVPGSQPSGIKDSFVVSEEEARGYNLRKNL